MRKLLSAVILALVGGTLLVGQPAAYAQNTITIDQMIVRVWPEFDQPSALVFYIGQVSPEVELPVELTFTIPSGVAVHAAATEDLTSGALFDTTYNVEGDTVTLLSDNGTFHIEFYDSTFQINAAQRSYNLTYVTDYPVNRLIWGVQIPAQATGFTALPEGGTNTSDQFGLAVYEGLRTDVPAGEPLTIDFSYEKQSPALTVDLLQQQQPAGVPPAATQSTASTGSPTWLTVLIIVAVVGVLGGGGYYLWSNRKPQRGSKRTRPSGEQRYCTQCGKPIGRKDAFCRHCGAEQA